MNQTENLQAYAWTAVASGFVGLLVGVTALLVQLYEPVMLRILISSILAGAAIGTSIRGICLWMAGQNDRKSVFHWIFIFLIIGIGTMIATECIGKLPLGKAIILVVIAEIFGMAVAYANYRQFIYINKKLRQKREHFRDQLLSQIEE